MLMCAADLLDSRVYECLPVMGRAPLPCAENMFDQGLFSCDYGRFVQMCLLQHASGIDRHRQSGDVARFVGSQEEHRIADIHGLDPADWKHVHELGGDGEIVRSRRLEVGPEEL